MSLTSINPRVEAINNLGEMGADVSFKTVEVPLYFKKNTTTYREEFEEVGSRKGLVNNDTGQYIATVGNKYHNPYSHAEQFKFLEKSIIKSDLDLTGLQRHIGVSHNGARAFARYTFPAHTVEIGRTGPVELDLLARNSYDGTWPSVYEAGAKRTACLNQMVFGQVFAVAKQRHTKNINHPNAADQVMGCLRSFLEETSRWASWLNTEVSDRQAFECLAILSGNTQAVLGVKHTDRSILSVFEEATKTKDGSERRRSPRNTLWTLWCTDYRPTLGPNLWALYNVMTHWSTHCQQSTKVSSETVQSLQIKSGDKVKKMISNNKIFKIAA